MRRISIYLAIAALSVSAAIATSCGGGDSAKLIFNQGQTGCAAASQPVATIQCGGGAVTFEGSVLTPNPCYYLKAQIDFADKSEMEIVITATSQPGDGAYCIECLGKISFNGTVEIADACGRSLSILYNDAVIAEYEQQ